MVWPSSIVDGTVYRSKIPSLPIQVIKGREPTKFSGSLIFINFSWNLPLGFLIFIHQLISLRKSLPLLPDRPVQGGNFLKVGKSPRCLLGRSASLPGTRGEFSQGYQLMQSGMHPSPPAHAGVFILGIRFLCRLVGLAVPRRAH